MDCVTATYVMLAGFVFSALIGFGAEVIATKLGYTPTNYLLNVKTRRQARAVQAAA